MPSLHAPVCGLAFRHDFGQAKRAASDFDRRAATHCLHVTDGKVEPSPRELTAVELFQRLSNGRFWRQPKRPVGAFRIA